ncbi:MAG: glycosyltransferase family 39 protein [Clostridia bacterium]|nr:glycosyltransferase family 39 protein [Clostridia bacterium]
MKLKKNLFGYFAMLVFLVCILFAMVCTFQRLGNGQEYPYLLKGEWLLGALAGICLLTGGGALWFRLDLSRSVKQHPAACLTAEGLAVASLTVLALWLRLRVIRELPMDPESDYKTFYGIAEMLTRGTLLEKGIGYCDYISMFPHVYGYPAILSWAFSLFGVSLHTALMFNLFLETASCLIIWRIGRLAAGRLCGLITMAAYTFLPSAVLYSNFAASEPLFTFLLLCGIWLVAMSLPQSPRKERHPWLCFWELAGAGLLLGVAGFVRPMAILFLIAAVICILPGRASLPELPPNDIPLGLRTTSRGWRRVLILAGVYFLSSSLLSMGAGYAVNRELAGSTASYGYNLLVGLNQESYGGWNQEDADYLYSALENTGSAQEAQLACRDLAMERLKTDPRALINLFVHKFDVLWGNDDYGASWNILFMDQQGNLTPEREAFLYRMMDVSDMYYLTLLLGAGIFGVLMLRRRPDVLYACLLLFCATVALHLLVENQNRYHYHAMPLLCLFTGAAVKWVLNLVDEAVMKRIHLKRREEAEKQEMEAERARRQQEKDELARLRAEALHAQFDMEKAIREGHIRIVGSQGIAAHPASQSPTEKQEQGTKREEHHAV